jgi:hypothetical protein
MSYINLIEAQKSVFKEIKSGGLSTIQFKFTCETFSYKKCPVNVYLKVCFRKLRMNVFMKRTIKSTKQKNRLSKIWFIIC